MRLALLIGTCALLWSFESVWPLQRYRDSRLRRRLPNVALTVLVVLLNLALSFAVAAVAGTGELTLLNVFLGIAALDLATYTAHVVLHKSSFAWRFHRVHHSENEVDVTTAFRQHPGETLWRVAWQLPPVLLLGLPFVYVTWILHTVAIAAHRTRALLVVTAIGTGLNVGLNLFLIPRYSYNGAAVATVISEVVAMAALMYGLRTALRPDYS